MSTPETAREPARILIAADEPMVSRILEHKLRREGHHVATVRDGAAMWRVLDAGEADVLLVDSGLDSDGIALMEELSYAGQLPNAGWFAVVERLDPASHTRAMRAGAVGLVVKPFKPSVVAAQVAALLELVA
ncbi:MAG TPA: response regulator [Candidatus Dormibacteraeota bacterium]|nr:response regulator [Candidatus Dormibacteraeota bacterium]